MNVTRRTLLGMSSAILLGKGAFSQTHRAVAKDRKVLVISVDGLPAFAWRDPNLSMPFLRGMVNKGAFANRMTTVNLCMTWPNHTSMVTGVSPFRHGLLSNGLPTFAGSDGPVRINERVDKDTLVLVPTVYDLAAEHSLTSAEVNWVAIENAKNISWSLPGRPTTEGKFVKEMTAEGIVSTGEIKEWLATSTAWKDYARTQATIQLIKKHKPNLLLAHLERSDGMSHLHGPGSKATQLAYMYVDTCIRDILGAIREAGELDKTTVLIVSDHGFRRADRLIRPNAALHEMGLLKESGGTITCEATALTQGGHAIIWIRNKARSNEISGLLKERFQKMEGIADVVDPSRYAEFDLPDPKSNSRIGDLVLFPKDGYAFWRGNSGEPVVGLCGNGDPGHHGYPNTDPDMDASFLAWGHGIRRGVTLDKMRNVDVAPTVANLLGFPMNGVDGRVLSEILVSPAVG